MGSGTNTTFFLTNIDPQTGRAGVSNVKMATNATSSAEMSPAGYLSPHLLAKTHGHVSSSSGSDDEESISSWPFSRPPSLSHFDGDDDLESRFHRRKLPLSPPTFWTDEFSSIPRLVMPRVALPTRKPFTPNGLRLGKLKILVAGDSGVGKTELIKAILESTKDIVHVDEPKQVVCSDDLSQPADKKPAIVEISASTKPYPLYWLTHHEKLSSNDINDDPDTSSATIEGRRPSLIHSIESATSSDGALDRNICFVDTPGYGQFTNAMTCVQAVTSYLDKRFYETANVVNVSNPQVVNLLTTASSLSEFPHVDVCFYLILDRIKKVDIDYIARISKYVPVIPLIAKSDILPKDGIVDLKVQILKELKAAHISPFLFDTQLDDAIQFGEQLIRSRTRRGSQNGGNDMCEPSAEASAEHVQGEEEKGEEENYEGEERQREREGLIYPLLLPSAITSHRTEEMVASVLMAPDYTPELVKSGLNDLCRYVLSEHGSAWLRFSAAKKFVQWIAQRQVSSALYGGSASLMVGEPSSSLVKYNGPMMDRPRGTIEIMPEYFVSLPSAMLGNRDQAQVQTARWAMQLEQASRTENVIAIRAQTYQPPPVGGKVINRSGRMSDSVSNLDPLGLKDLSGNTLRYAWRTLSVIVGIKIVSWIYLKLVPSKVDPRPSESVLATALNSLGGGWSVLV
jgi:septin family protein